MWAPRQEPDSGNKTSRSHYKILFKLTEICWRWHSITGSYSVQNWVGRTTCGPHVKSRALEIEPRVHIIKFYQWLKFVVDDSNWQPGSYSLQSSVARTTHEFHVKSRTLEIEPHVHIIKFYHWLKFVGDGSNYITATLCTIVWVDKHVCPISRVKMEEYYAI